MNISQFPGLIVLCVGYSLFGVDPLAADASLIYTGGQNQQHRVLVKSGRVRLEQGTAARIYAIFSPEAGRMLNINEQRRQYVQIDAASTKAMAERVQSTRQQMLNQLPPEQRQQMEQRMKSQLEAPRLHTQQTNKQKTVNGFTCHIYSVIQDERPAGQVCVARLADLTLLSSQDYASLMALNDFNRSMTEISSRSFDFGLQDIDLDGIPVEVIGPDGQVVMALEKLTNDALPTQLFEVPADYTPFDPIRSAPTR